MRIIKYEFNDYIEVEYNNTIFTINVSDITPFISNEMTNHLTNITDEYILWLENYIINTNG
jgi:hypothetical protein